MYMYILCLCAIYFGHNSTQDTHDQGSGTPDGTQSGRNTKDKKNRHPIIPKLIIIKTTYFKSIIDKVHSAVDSLIMCFLTMALCGRNM
jgi:hypothetical protein